MEVAAELDLVAEHVFSIEEQVCGMQAGIETLNEHCHHDAWSAFISSYANDIINLSQRPIYVSGDFTVYYSRRSTYTHHVHAWIDHKHGTHKHTCRSHTMIARMITLAETSQTILCHDATRHRIAEHCMTEHSITQQP